jgi:hypothetical protein
MDRARPLPDSLGIAVGKREIVTSLHNNDTASHSNAGRLYEFGLAAIFSPLVSLFLLRAICAPAI